MLVEQNVDRLRFPRWRCTLGKTCDTCSPQIWCCVNHTKATWVKYLWYLRVIAVEPCSSGWMSDIRSIVATLQSWEESHTQWNYAMHHSLLISLTSKVADDGSEVKGVGVFRGRANGVGLQPQGILNWHFKLSSTTMIHKPTTDDGKWARFS